MLRMGILGLGKIAHKMARTVVQLDPEAMKRRENLRRNMELKKRMVPMKAWSQMETWI